MTGEHQRHHLVAHLLGGEALAGLVAHAEQEAEDVATGLVRIRPTTGDLVVDDLVEDGARAHHLRPGRAGAAQQPQVEVDAVEAESALEVLRGGRSLPRLVGVEPEQGPHRDPHRQPPHPLVYVDDLAGSQTLDRRRCLAGHCLDRRRDLLAVEGGHHDLARPVVVGVVDRQQAVAEQRDQVAEARLAPVEVLGVAHGDELIGLGAEHEDHRVVEEPGAEDRPVLLIEREEQRQRVPRRLQGAAEVEVLRTRRVGAAAPYADLRAHVFGDPAHRIGAQLPRRLDPLGRLDGTLNSHDQDPSWLTGQTTDCAG